MAEAEFKDHSTAMDSEPNPGTSSVLTTTSSTTTTTITTSSSRMQQPQISVYSGSDRHAVQVIQQALHRPPSSAAQYLQQMYAAQQQHLMLYIAALQQHYLSSSQLQSLAAVQASLSSGRPSTSPTGSVTQQSSMSQTSINLSTSPTPAQLISRSQASSSTSGSITQQTMLLGSTSPTVKASQTQMYLRAQMFKMTEREEQRICIKFCVKLEHSSAETIRMIHKAFGDEAMSAAQIKVWHKRFKDGRESIESDPRSGRPAASRPPENVECVQAAISKGAYLEGD